MAKGQQDGMVRTAIPRAKPSNNMQRVSPGVYRDGSGKLVRSRDGFDPAAKQELINKAYEASRDVPKGGGMTDMVDRTQRAAPGGSKPGQWSGSTNATPSERYLGPTPGAQPSRQANDAADMAGQLARDFIGNAGAQPSNIDDLMNWIGQLTQQQPSRGRGMGSGFADLLQSGIKIPPAPRPITDIPGLEGVQMGNSIADMLRRR